MQAALYPSASRLAQEHLLLRCMHGDSDGAHAMPATNTLAYRHS